MQRMTRYGEALMMEFVELDSTPTEEECEQLGPNYDPHKARRECLTFIEQIKRTFGEPPQGVRIKVSSNAHDFGTYYGIKITFNDSDDDGSDYAYKIEGDLPKHWDEQAKKDLAMGSTSR
jgi:hypothetical protein